MHTYIARATQHGDKQQWHRMWGNSHHAKRLSSSTSLRRDRRSGERRGRQPRSSHSMNHQQNLSSGPSSSWETRPGRSGGEVSLRSHWGAKRRRWWRPYRPCHCGSSSRRCGERGRKRRRGRGEERWSIGQRRGRRRRWRGERGRRGKGGGGGWWSRAERSLRGGWR